MKKVSDPSPGTIQKLRQEEGSVDWGAVGVPMDGRGPAFELVSGDMFHPLDPRASEIDLGHIAHATSKLCRFTGHVQEFYSVAQHGVFVSHIVAERDPQYALWGLLHDAAEAYTGDISRPLKQALDSVAPGVLKNVELHIEEAIAEKFALEWPMPDAVKHADNVALATEKRDLLPNGRTPWPNMPEPIPERIVPMDPDEAHAAFLARYDELGA